MLEPKRTKYRKNFRGKMRGYATRGNQVAFGDFGLQAIGRAWVSARQIEAARKVIVRETGRKGKLWIKIFPDKSYTSKPAEVKMGKGKGDVEGYVAVVKPGRILFELSGVDANIAQTALSQAGQKLPIKTRVLQKEL